MTSEWILRQCSLKPRVINHSASCSVPLTKAWKERPQLEQTPRKSKVLFSVISSWGCSIPEALAVLESVDQPGPWEQGTEVIRSGKIVRKRANQSSWFRHRT